MLASNDYPEAITWMMMRWLISLPIREGIRTYLILRYGPNITRRLKLHQYVQDKMVNLQATY